MPFDTRLTYEVVSEIVDDWWKVFALLEAEFNTKIAEDVQMNSLSGGQWLKLLVCAALCSDASLILLDEPTNHLDLESRDILARLLKEYNGSILFVSHDIAFVEEVANTIWEVKDAKIASWTGSYQEYLAYKKSIADTIAAQQEKQQKQLKKAEVARQRQQERYAKSEAKIRKMARSDDRSMPRGARDALKKKVEQNRGTAALKQQKKITAIEHKIETLAPAKKKRVSLPLVANKSKGLLVSFDKATLKIGELELSAFDLEIAAGDRIALLGANGSGKSTLASQLKYRHSPLVRGKKTYGRPYSFLQLDQHYSLIDSNATLYKNLAEENRSLTHTEVRTLLANAGFTDVSDPDKPASGLSGGERARLGMAMLATSGIDLLVLDEPTNNLDVQTKKAVAAAVADFKGTLFVISHDREFLAEVGIQSFYKISSGRILQLSQVDIDRLLQLKQR